MNKIKAYRQRGTWGGIEQPERLRSFEWHHTDSDGEDHITSLPATSLEEAKRHAAQKCGLSPGDIPVEIV